MDAARELFEQIINGGYDFIQKMVNEEWQENLLLDFKCTKNNKAPMADDDKRSLAKELSAVANSDGGVIVWGIYAKSLGPTDPDVAQSHCPIQNLDLFISNLQQNTPQVVSPGIIGVQHHSIPDPKDSTVGYVVTYVPKGQGEPHMARAKDQHRFYYRSGSSSLIMEPFMLADRYGRRPQPKLELTWDISWDGSADGYVLGLIVGIKNIGLGIATYPALAVYRCDFFGLNINGVDDSGRFGLPLRPVPSHLPSRIFAGGINDVVHPGTKIDVVRFRGSTSSQKIDLIPIEISLRYELYCDGFSYQSEALIPARHTFERIFMAQALYKP